MTQSPNPQPPIYNQPNWQVGTVNQSITYITQAAERPPLWVQVPARPARFLGREPLMDDLVARLLAEGTPTVAVHGLPGVGKSSVAAMLAHHKQILAHFSDGILWAGLGLTPDLPSLLLRWASALEIDISQLRTDGEKAQTLRDAIGHKRLLLVIDDAWQIEPARILHCGGPNCAYLLTTRDSGLARAFAGADQSVEIPLLAEDPAHTLLRTLAPEAWQANPGAAAQLADSVNGLPLALELLGSYLADPQNNTFAELLDASLTESVAGADLRSLALLAARHLLEVAPDESLSLHQTLADVARTRTAAEAVTRHREHYLERVNADRENWQAIEAVYLQVQRAWQCTPRTDLLTVEFVDSLSTYQTRRGLWVDRLTWLDVALAFAEQNGNLSAQARMLHEFGVVYAALGENEKALTYYKEALPLSRRMGDPKGEASTLNNIGTVYADLGEKANALGYYEQTLSLFRHIGNGGGEATTLTGIGAVYADLEEKAKALGYYEQALSLFRQGEVFSEEATTLTKIGEVYAALGENEKALGYYEEALPLIRQVGDRSGEAATLDNIGMVYSVLGEKGKALGYYADALPLRRQVGDRRGEATTLSNIGEVYSALGEMEKALGYYTEALPLKRQVGDRFGESVTRFNMAMVFVNLDRLAEAEEQLEIVVQIDEAVRHPDLESDRQVLEQVRAMRR